MRKEKGVTQKEAAVNLGVSQALLSHYEKGIRECGLDFVVRLADYYDVSCDYLLGRSADRSGLTLKADDLPEADGAKNGGYKGSLLPTLNKKIIANSLNILFDKLTTCPDKGLVNEISTFLMIAVYRMFRLVYGANTKNSDNMFSISKVAYTGYASAAMSVAEAKAAAQLAGEAVGDQPAVKDTSGLAMTTESLSTQYPLYSTSLLNLIKTSESEIKKQM